MSNFMSTKLVDQLRVRKEALAIPLNLHMAVAGSQLKINCYTIVKLEVLGIVSE